MNITSLSFTDSPVYHQFPPLYEDLGLLEVSSYIEQRFEFRFTLGKIEKNGCGSIRYYKKQNHFTVMIPNKLPGIGSIKLENLKSLLLQSAKNQFIENIASVPQPQKVYYTDFRNVTNDQE